VHEAYGDVRFRGACVAPKGNRTAEEFRNCRRSFDVAAVKCGEGHSIIRIEGLACTTPECGDKHIVATRSKLRSNLGKHPLRTPAGQLDALDHKEDTHGTINEPSLF
jgi:hypothetical protein